jgi:hypothetical protein
LQRFNAKYAQPEKSQSNANQKQHNWRWFTHAVSRRRADWAGGMRFSVEVPRHGPRSFDDSQAGA